MRADDVYDCPSCGAEVLEMDVKCAGCGSPLASTGALRMVGQMVLDQYEVLEVIGQGGMAVVYAARHQLTGQEVALKILPPEKAAHRSLQSRFVEEARALARLDHPNIVHLYNFGSDQGCFVLAMQLVRGKTWEKLIVDGGLEWRRSVEIALDVTRALEYAHDRDVIHRDMKPSNVVIRSDQPAPIGPSPSGGGWGGGAAMVMDFGIAKSDRSSRLTDTGQTMGTVRYMSPEQVRGKEVDGRSDLYSLGVSLYEALAGTTPFDGDTHFDIMNAHLEVVPPPLAERAPEIPASLARVVHWLLAKHPGDRPDDAAAAGRALEAILGGAEPAVPADSRVTSVATLLPAARAASGARRRIALGAALAIAAVAAGAVVFWVSRGEAPAPSSAVPPPLDAAPARIPPGFEVAVELDYSEDGLRILAAPGVSTEGILDRYRAGVARWRRYLDERGLHWPELARPVPPVTVLIGPAELVCNPAVFDTDEGHRECVTSGSYLPAERVVRIPASSRYLELALHSAVPIAHCARSERCMVEANQYLLALYK